MWIISISKGSVCFVYLKKLSMEKTRGDRDRVVSCSGLSFADDTPVSVTCMCTTANAKEC